MAGISSPTFSIASSNASIASTESSIRDPCLTGVRFIICSINESSLSFMRSPRGSWLGDMLLVGSMHVIFAGLRESMASKNESSSQSFDLGVFLFWDPCIFGSNLGVCIELICILTALTAGEAGVWGCWSCMTTWSASTVIGCLAANHRGVGMRMLTSRYLLHQILAGLIHCRTGCTLVIVFEYFYTLVLNFATCLFFCFLRDSPFSFCRLLFLGL